MEQFKNLKQQLKREYGIIVYNITEESNYSPSYIGPKRYMIHYEDTKGAGNGTVRRILPSEICDELWRNAVDWNTVSAIVNFIIPHEEYYQKKEESADYRATSNKSRTRKELNRIKVKGYYDTIELTQEEDMP